MDVSCRSAVVRTLLSIEANDDLSSAVALIDALVVSRFEQQFVVKCLSRLVLRFHSLLVSKRLSIQSFLTRISRQNSISALLTASLALCTSGTTSGQLRHNYVIETLQSIDQSLATIAYDVSAALNNIRFRALVLANLIAFRTSVPFPLPVQAVIKQSLQLCSAPSLDPIIVREAAPVLRESGFRILEALLVTLENDLIVFCAQINRSIVDCIEEPEIESFLLKYLRISSIRFSDNHLSRIIQTLKTRIHSTDKRRAGNAFKCLAALLIHGFDARDLSLECSQLLLRYYRSRADNNSLDDSSLRKQFFRLMLAIDKRHPTTVSLLSLAVARDDNHDIRHFCLRAINGFEVHENDIIRVSEEVIEMEVIEPLEESFEEPVMSSEPVLSSEPVSESELMLKEFCFE